MQQRLTDQRAENRLSPNRPCDYETLAALGVFYKRFDPAHISDNEEEFIKPLIAELGYHAHDVVTISPDAMGESFESMAKQHFQEHLHEDDEVRLILDGSGYFDIRSALDEWIRVLTKPGDCIIVPRGIYHRFTTDANLYTKALRLFKENPKWIAIPRENGEGDRTQTRREYLRFLREPPNTSAGPAADALNGVFSLRYPTVFDTAMTNVLRHFAKEIEKVKASSNNNSADNAGKEGELGALLLYVTGAASPYTDGASWCPDCVDAKPAVLKGFQLLKERYHNGDANAPAANTVFFVEAPVERSAYRGNPDYPYRTHEFLKIAGVPTVFVLTLKKGALAYLLPDEAQEMRAKRNWFDLIDVRVRTEKPTGNLLGEY